MSAQADYTKKKGAKKPKFQGPFLAQAQQLPNFITANQNFQTPGHATYVRNNPSCTPGSALVIFGCG